MKILLEAIVGSQAYGLNTKDSDVDKMGVFTYKTTEVLRLQKLKDTVVKNDPDVVYHEVEKFIRLVSKNNPSVLELLFLDKYDTMTDEGRLLIAGRHHFLSTTIFHSYGGYAIAQARKLNRRGHSFSSKVKNRHSKHARHCFRLLMQGTQLLKEQTLTVKVEDKKRLFEIGELPVDEMVSLFEKEFAKFDKIQTKLPPEPNFEEINKMLLQIRRMNNDL